jgi:aminoglycoside phosphotransferase family enzyme
MLVEQVTQRHGDNGPARLLKLYEAFRAVLRARLALAHLLDPMPREPAKWQPLARRYLALAEQALGAPR